MGTAVVTEQYPGVTFAWLIVYHWLSTSPSHEVQFTPNYCHMAHLKRERRHKLTPLWRLQSKRHKVWVIAVSPTDWPNCKQSICRLLEFYNKVRGGKNICLIFILALFSSSSCAQRWNKRKAEKIDSPMCRSSNYLTWAFKIAGWCWARSAQPQPQQYQGASSLGGFKSPSAAWSSNYIRIARKRAAVPSPDTSWIIAVFTPINTTPLGSTFLRLKGNLHRCPLLD